MDQGQWALTKPRRGPSTPAESGERIIIGYGARQEPRRTMITSPGHVPLGVATVTRDSACHVAGLPVSGRQYPGTGTG